MKLKYLSGILALAAGLFVVSCDDDDETAIATGNIITEVTTGDPVSVTAVSAVVQGTVKDLSQSSSSSYSVGVYYGTADNPTVSGARQTGTIDENGTVTTTLSGLTEGVTYYYATFVTLQSRVTAYGDVKSFTATDVTVTTSDATDITATGATLSAQFAGIDGLDNPETGVKLALTAEGVQEGKVYPLSAINGLLPGTTYYFAAYVSVGGSNLYGETKIFTTEAQEMEYVDLGLSVMWARWNIGAAAESEAGALFGYGDPTSLLLSDVASDYPAENIAGTEYDAAFRLDIDGTSEQQSRMPSSAELAELLANTTQEAAEADGVAGVRFTASNGNSIFLPVTGYRDGETTLADGIGHYWSGNVDAANNAYAGCLTLDGASAQAGYSLRQLGFAVRSVREKAGEPSQGGEGDGIQINNDGIDVGDLENNGRLRIQIYNMGSGEGVNPDDISFSRNMVVTFTISGITDNLKADAPSSFIAGLQFADKSWAFQYWSEFAGDKYDATVTGDGTYTVWTETSGGTAEGCMVFCIDIKDLHTNLADPSQVSVTVDSIEFDKDIE